MNDAQRHTIGKIVLDIETAEPEDEVWTLQEDLSQLMQQRASAEIAALLDQWVNADEVIRLDELTLELPPIEYDALTSEFIPRLLEALRDALAARLPQPLAQSQMVQDSAFSALDQSLRPDSSQPLPADSPQSLPQGSSSSSSQTSAEEDSALDLDSPTSSSQSSFAADWEVLIYFLEYGRLPWWQPSAPFSDWVAAWAAALNSGFAGNASLQQLLAKQPAARQRLITQLPSSFVQALITQWQPAWTVWPTLFAHVQALIQFSKANTWQSPALSTATIHYLEQQAKLILCEQLATHTSENVPFPLRAWLDAWLPIFVKAISHGRGLASAPADSLPQGPAVVEQIGGEQIDGEQIGGGVRSLQTYLHKAISTLKLNNASAWQSAINRHVLAAQPSPTFNAAANPDTANPNASANGTSSTAQVRNMRQAEKTTAMQSPDFQARELSSATQDAISSPLNPSVNEQGVQPPDPVLPPAATSSAAQRPTDSELSSTFTDAAEASPEGASAMPHVTPTVPEVDSVASEVVSTSPEVTSMPSNSDLSLLNEDAIEPTAISEPSLQNVSQVEPTQSLPNQDLTITPQTLALPNQSLPSVEAAPPRINPVMPSESAETDNDPIEPAPPPTSSTQPVSDEIPSSSLSATDTSATDMSAALGDEESVFSHPLVTDPPKRAIFPNLSRDEIANGIYLNNAGLVLLHPFLRIYFDDLGLLTEDDFASEYAQQQAIALLHTLATGQTDAPEYDLVLPKLLCGWPLNEPVNSDLQLSPNALAEGEKLLQAVINYWDVLKNTTPNGLREGFIQRQGKLTYTDHWKLRVEQQAIDILLSRLPWGLSMVKLPWMPTLLIVEWT